MESGQFSFDAPQIATHYDETAPRLIPGYQEVLEALPTLVDSADTVLVVGCGTGVEIASLRADGRTIVGVDPAESMIQLAHARFPGFRDVRLLHGDVSNLAPMDRFSAVTCLFVSHFVQGKVRLWQSIAAKLEPGGLLVCADFVRPDGQERYREAQETWFKHLVEQEMPESVTANERRQFATKFHLSTDKQYQSALSQAGFGEITLVGTWLWTHLYVARVS